MKKTTKIIFIVLRVLLLSLIVGAFINYLVTDIADVKSNMLFICGQASLYLIVTFVPNILKWLRIVVPDYIYIIFIVFCGCHFVLGEILGFFATLNWWDGALHTISGMFLTVLSFSLLDILNGVGGEKSKLSVPLACVFAVSVTIAIGVVWEVVEFIADCMFELNMQRSYVSTISGERGEPLMGQTALFDTMKDLILDVVGAVIVCIIAIIYATKTKCGVDKLIIIKREPKTSQLENQISIEDVVNKSED